MLRTDYDADDHTRMWEHLNEVGGLANASFTALKIVASGVYTFSGLSVPTQGFASGPVSFPAGRFSVAPAVVVSTESAFMVANAYNRTTSGFAMAVTNWRSTAFTGTLVCCWVAVQI